MKTVKEMFLNTFLDFRMALTMVIRVKTLNRVPVKARTMQIISPLEVNRQCYYINTDHGPSQ